MSAHATVRTLLLGLCLAGTLPVTGQERTSIFNNANIDVAIDNHVRFLARRYNLTPEQETYTQAFLHQKANDFLGRHREELFSILDRWVEVRTGGNMEQQELIDWGRRAQPLYDEVKQLVVQGNNDWREILNEQQKQVHDQDLKQMYQSFAQADTQIQKIVAGQLTVEEFRKGPAPPVGPVAAGIRPQPPGAGGTAAPAPANPTVSPAGVQPGSTVPPPPNAAVQPTGPQPTGPSAATPTGKGGRPTSAPAGVATRPAGPRAPADPNSWDAYVRDFIQRYQLDEAQQQRANTTLANAKENANRFLARTRPEIERIDKKIQEVNASNSKDKVKEVQELNQKKQDKLEPLKDIYEKQLKAQLERLPTKAQRAAAEAAGKANPTPATPGQPPPRPGVQPTPGQPTPNPTKPGAQPNPAQPKPGHERPGRRPQPAPNTPPPPPPEPTPEQPQPAPDYPTPE